MCFSSPSVPAAPPPPERPPAPPTEADPAVKAAREDAKRKAQALAGYSSTIASSPLGVTGAASTTAGKTLLGA